MHFYMWSKIIARAGSYPGTLRSRFRSHVCMSFISETKRGFRTSTTALSKHKSQDKVIKSPFPDVEIPNVTYPEFAFSQMEKFRDQPFLVNGETGQEYSYHDVLGEVCRVASCLMRRGLGPGDQVAFFSFNQPEYIISWFAAVAVGAIAIEVNPNFTAGEVHHQLKETNTKYLFVHWSNAQTAREAIATLHGIKEIFVFGNADRCVPYSELRKDAGDLFKGPVAGDPKDTIHMPYSSGTTGLPKGVMRSHYNLVASAYVTK